MTPDGLPPFAGPMPDDMDELPGLQHCPSCGRLQAECECTEDDMNRWAHWVLYNGEHGYPDPNCYYCGGTGMAGDGWHDCPVCMGITDTYDEDDEYKDISS